MARKVFEWLDAWWHIAGEIASEPDNATPDDPGKWEGYVYEAGLLPDNVNGIRIRPLKRFLRAVVALWDPSPVNGPRPTARKLQALSSEAWGTYQRLHEKRDLLEAGDMSAWHPRGEWYKQFPRSESWCRGKLTEWICDGIAETQSERGDIRFRLLWLKENDITPPG